MATMAIEASKQRPTPVSRWFAKDRRRRVIVVATSLVAAAALAIFFGTWRGDETLEINENLYLATAGLFVAALAIERLTELLVAPWVGGGDVRIDRNILVGGFTLVLGVTASGLLGLRLLALLSGDDAVVGWLAASVDTFATGLAIGAGGKPLHDLITRLEKNVETAKESHAAAESPPPPSASAVDSGPAGGAFRLALSVRSTEPSAADPTSDANLSRLLPGWDVFRSADAPGSALVHHVTNAVPGSPPFIQELFSAAHRLHGVGAEVTVSPAVMRATPAGTAPATPHGALNLLDIDAGVIRDGKGGRGVTVAVLDTGIRLHEHGIKRWAAGHDIIDGDNDPTDPLIGGANWLDFDLVGSPGHGTGVAAVIAGPGDAASDVLSDEWWDRSAMIGVAPLAVICPVRVMRGPVHLLDTDVARGVQSAIDAQAHVISMSLGGLAFRGLREAIDKAVEHGIIVVCAAGNQFGVVVEPASYPNTIAVASVDMLGRPYFEGSSRGPEVTVSAPGVRVLRPDFDIERTENGPSIKPVLEPGTGTTYATAHVAGLAALWLAKHGRDKLLFAYPGRLPHLFAYVLAETVTQWSDKTYASDWGPGSANAKKLLDFTVLDGDRPAVNPDVLDVVFERKPALAVSERFAGGIAAVLTADGTTEARSDIVAGLLEAWSATKKKREVPAVVPSVRPTERADFDEKAAMLLGAELSAHAQANPNFRRALASATDTIPVPASATPELKLVLAETNRLPGREMPPDWGVGLSLPLRRALHGFGRMQRGYRSVGLLALAAALVVVAIDGLVTDGNPSTDQITSAVGLLGIGLYGGAQAIERFLEFTVGRFAFRDVPGREADRALILLGCGILIGTLAAIVLDFGLLGEISQPQPDDAWFRSADLFVTALAIGGGAKPLHDLLTRIRLRNNVT